MDKESSYQWLVYVEGKGKQKVGASKKWIDTLVNPDFKSSKKLKIVKHMKKFVIDNKSEKKLDKH